MKIRTITCHQSLNHGAMLQAYALATHLRSLGHDVKVIDYTPPYMNSKHRIPPSYDYWGVRSLYLLVKWPEDYEGRIRKRVLKPFLHKYIPVTVIRYNSIGQLRQNPPEADLYIAGSDQIWNTTFQNGLDPAFYLDFGTPKRRISYAASFATPNLADGAEDFVKDKLSRLDAISVREESGRLILKELGYDGVVVVDPVFLLSPEQWKVIDDGQPKQERYILTYDFEKKGESIGTVAKRLARLADCKIYSVSPFRQKYAHQNFVNVGPDMFVSLVKNAQCVIGNSFHGAAFSMIFEKDFFVVNRKDGLNVRMQDLLNRYGLSRRLISPDVSDESLMTDIYYKPVQEKLQQDIDFSKSFLQHQIELAEQ